MFSSRCPYHLARSSRSGIRMFSSTSRNMDKLRIGYVPEHFSTPLHFAMDKFNLSDSATLIPFPAGTGKMIEAFYDSSIDVGIGLTDPWIAGLSRHLAAQSESNTSRADAMSNRPYHITGAYTSSPLRWAIITGGRRSDVEDANVLRGKKVGVSRIGSGSHVMSNVLALYSGWLDKSASQADVHAPFEVVVCGVFADLRKAVNDGAADFFMWEHYTTKRYFDNGDVKRVGEIPTPWNAWTIATRGPYADERVTQQLLPALDKGVKHFRENPQEAIEFICENMDYSKEDAGEWMKEVKFPDRMGEVDMKGLQDISNILNDADAMRTSTDADFLVALEK